MKIKGKSGKVRPYRGERFICKGDPRRNVRGCGRISIHMGECSSCKCQMQ